MHTYPIPSLTSDCTIQLMPGEQADKAAYNISMLRQALELMVVAAPKCDTEAFRYDLVDVAREWLSYGPCVDKLEAINIRAAPSEINTATQAFLDVTADIDSVLKSNRGFLLGSWLNGSRRVADWDGSTPSTKNGNRCALFFI